MKPQDRILDAATQVFFRHGFRRSSIEQAAEAAGLTRQALYHHFDSKEALFRAVIERLNEQTLAADIAAADAAEKQGGGLADILVAGIDGRFRHVLGSFRGSPHIEELYSEHLLQARDLYQKYSELYAGLGVARIQRICRAQRISLRKGMTADELARYVEMAVNGAKSKHPAMQPPEAFLADVETMVRMLVAGAVAISPAGPGKAASKTAKKSTNKILRKSIHRKMGDRK
jgi:AcrR family transcriptional regulator